MEQERNNTEPSLFEQSNGSFTVIHLDDEGGIVFDVVEEICSNVSIEYKSFQAYPKISNEITQVREGCMFICDLQMPGLPGELVAQSTIRMFPEIPVVILSATEEVNALPIIDALLRIEPISDISYGEMGSVDYLNKFDVQTRLKGLLLRFKQGGMKRKFRNMNSGDMAIRFHPLPSKETGGA